MESEKKRLNPLRALRWRDFRLLWGGQAISSLGSTFQAAALPWMIMSRHGSAFDLALTLLALTLPQAILTLFGGILVDRLDARLVMILADSLRILTASTLALMAEHALTPLWQIWLVLVVHGSMTALFTPAARTIAPFLVSEEDLESANALTSGMTQMGASVGFFAAGGLVAAGGPALAFVLNAFSYVIAVCTALLMRPLERHSPSKRRRIGQEIWETVGYLRTVPWLLGLLIVDSLLAFSAISINSIGLPELASFERVGIQGYSLLIGSYYCGSVLGLLASAWHPIRAHRGLLCIVFHAAEALLMATVAFVPLPLGAICMMLWSALNGVLVVVTLSLIQLHVPPSLLGRIMAFWGLSSIWTLPIAQIAGGLIATSIGVKGLFLLAGSLVLASSLLGGSVPALRQLN